MAGPSVTTLVRAGEELKVLSETVVSSTGKRFLTKIVNSEGQVIQTLVAEATPKATLQNYLPSKISTEIKLAAQQAQERSAHAGVSVGKIMGQKLLSFPQEAGGFFIALGAVMTFELMFNEVHNPIAYEQLVESQMDPVGQVGFYSFMVANGVSSQALMSALHNGKLHPRLGPFIPFFGMGIGSVASNITQELLRAPNLRKCAVALITKQALDTSCDEAAKSWYERGGIAGLANEWSPGLISLMSSVVISGALQGMISNSGKWIVSKSIERGIIQTSIRVSADWTAQQVLKIGALELTALFVPGGIAIKGFKLGLFVWNLFVFSEVEERIRAPILFAYKNIWDQGPALAKMENQFAQDLLQLKQTQWKDEDQSNFSTQIEKFTGLMAAWRQTNLAPVLEAQSNWQQKLDRLAMGYSASKLFYNDFLTHLWERQYGENKDKYASKKIVRIIDRIYPLNGITPLNLDPKRLEVFSQAPDIVEEGQKEKIDQVLADYKAGKLFVGPLNSVDSGKLSQIENEQLVQILQGLMSPDLIVIGQTLDKLNCLVLPDSRITRNCKTVLPSERLLTHLKPIRAALGNPMPLWTPGLGYLSIFQNDSDKSLSQNILFPQAWGTLNTMSNPESMVAAMTAGPDPEKGQALIFSEKGFRSFFQPPQIVISQRLKVDLNIQSVDQLSGALQTIFNVPILANGKDRYANLYSFVSQGAIRPTVLNENRNSHHQWWEKYAETEYVNAWADYELKYQKNISQLVKLLWRTDDSLFNRTAIANGIMISLRQENNFYLMVLGELLKDHLKTDTPLSEAELTVSDKSISPRLFPFLRQGDNLQFSTILDAQNVVVHSKVESNSIWQNQLVKEFRELESLLKKIEPIEITDKDGSVQQATKTTVKNSQIEFQVEKMRNLISGVRSSYFSPRTMAGPMSPFQERIVAACFNGLEAVLKEVQTLGLVANAVSFSERHGEKGLFSPHCAKEWKQGFAGLAGVKALREAMAGCQK